MYYEHLKIDPVNQYFIFTKKELEDLKKNISKSTIEGLENSVKGMFDIPLKSVMDKLKIPPSGDKHNYTSLATYWWPNKDTKDGLPYVRDDGNFNPEGLDYDKDNYRMVAYITYHAGLLYYLTNDNKYYELIKKHCNYFFINKDTKMNPSILHGQFIPGINTGRGTGIIDFAANFTYALNILYHLDISNLLENKFSEDMKEWHKELRIWLETSKLGLKESTSKNNHGSMYDLGILTINMFLQEEELILKNSELFRINRINKQITKNFDLPEEMARTRSKTYSLMGFKAFTDYMKLVQDYKINFMKNETTSLKITNCMNWLVTDLVNDNWSYQQIGPFDNVCKLNLIYENNKLNKASINIEKINLKNCLNKFFKIIMLEKLTILK